MADQSWRLDLTDPRAPTREQWALMTAAERERVCASLPSEVPRATPPEGDPHRVPKTRALEALGEFFRRIGRRVYLSSELPVYYPGARMFAPDVIAVLDVEPHERERWVVSDEGKGIDLALEVTLAGDAKKDLVDNVARFAELGIPEYFVLDARTTRLVGYRLESGAYRPIVPQAGRWPSAVLGLDLALEGRRIRFFSGSAPLLESAELIGRLEKMTDDLIARKEDAERALASAEARASSAEARASSAEEQAARLARRLRELGVDPDER
ncbi:MAG: Uma2 family endonuclease [Myxococcales bacterium]|nr:Uma2 family endonuclease [Myxococcales bacterium]